MVQVGKGDSVCKAAIIYTRLDSHVHLKLLLQHPSICWNLVGWVMVKTTRNGNIFFSCTFNPFILISINMQYLELIKSPNRTSFDRGINRTLCAT